MKTILKSTMLLSALAFAACTTFISCEKDQDNSNEQLENEIAADKIFLPEQAYPGQKGEVVTIPFNGQSVEVEKINGKFIMGGDMLVIPDDMLITKNNKSFGRTDGRWPNNIVYYNIESSLPNKARVTDAIAHWEANTNLKFVKRTNQSAYINFYNGGGCNSAVGRTGGKQNISLANACNTGAAIHEIGHAVGLWHEQSRRDRDQYIRINFDNITPGKSHNFNKHTYNVDEYTDALDFNSIMMYSSYAFSKNGQPTIVKRDGSTYTSNRSKLSVGDISGIKKMYPGVSGNDICEGVDPWSRSKNYQVGDQVTYYGYLYKKTSRTWVNVGECGGNDICDGIAEPWSSSKNYQVGDRVTYNKYLFEKVSNGWTTMGKCAAFKSSKSQGIPDLNDVANN